MTGPLTGFVLARIDEDEERALRECAAKRALVALHAEGTIQVLAHIPARPSGECAACGRASEYGDGGRNEPWPCPTILAVASVYRDHPDYRPEWDAR